MEVKITNQPLAMHMKGTTTADGAQTPVEMIMVNGKSYIKLGQKWIKGPESKKEQADNPTEQLKKAQKAIDALGGNGQDGTRVTKEGDLYVVEITKSAIENQQFKSMLIEEVKEALKESLAKNNQNGEFQVDQLQFDQYQQKIWVNAKTFQYEKQWIEYSMTIPSKKSPLKINLKLDMKVKGPFEGKIELPAEVDKSK
jgi:hypothetical protein